MRDRKKKQGVPLALDNWGLRRCKTSLYLPPTRYWVTLKQRRNRNTILFFEATASQSIYPSPYGETEVGFATKLQEKKSSSLFHSREERSQESPRWEPSSWSRDTPRYTKIYRKQIKHPFGELTAFTGDSREQDRQTTYFQRKTKEIHERDRRTSKAKIAVGQCYSTRTNKTQPHRPSDQETSGSTNYKSEPPDGETALATFSAPGTTAKTCTISWIISMRPLRVQLAIICSLARPGLGSNPMPSITI